MSELSRRHLLMAALPLQQSQLHWLTLAEAGAMVRSRRISPVELTRACLKRIEQLNPKFNAFITVTDEQALAQARNMEAEQSGRRFRGPLHGIPIALKDLIDTAGIRTTAASAQYLDRVPSEDAEVVRRLKTAGAVILGKLNMDEFAYNFTSETSYFGPVPNPWNEKMIPGGSSGGSAVAVATGLCYGALGSDTGGSIRLPAALCGITGLKPTYGRVSTDGVVPLAWSLDHVGPMCRTAQDAALMLAAMDGTAPAQLKKPARLRLGIPRRLFFDNLDPEIESATGKAILALTRLPADAVEVTLPELEMAPDGPLPALSMLVLAEAYTFHARMFAKSPERYHPATRQSIELGASIPLPAYVQARHELDRLRRAVANVFETVDVLVTPPVSRQAFPLDPKRTPDLIYLRNTFPFDFYGLPTMSIPCGFTSNGMPIGLQIAGPALGEEKVLALAHAYQQLTEWHIRRAVK